MNHIDRTVEINSWADIKRKYIGYREELSEKEEKEFVEDCFSLYEKEGFSGVFWSQGDDYKEYHNKKFEVMRRCTEDDSDLCCLPMWMIKFEDNKEIAAYPDEIIPSEMIDNGCKFENLKRA